MDLRDLPMRLGAGAYILSSGLDKFRADEKAAVGYHRSAAEAYPLLKDIDPRAFTKALAATEVSLGAGLLTPFAPRRLVAVAFTGFSAALVGMYLRTPGLHRGPHDPRPSGAGVGIAKDVIMLGAAVSYVLRALMPATKKAGRSR